MMPVTPSKHRGHSGRAQRSDLECERALQPRDAAKERA